MEMKGLVVVWLFPHVCTGVSQLILRSVETGQPFPMPGNITVGLASDLAVQVQCTPESGTGIVTWEYRNGTEVPSGLQPFGISQGEEGILRVYPANQLMIESRFICSAGTNGPTLNVSFTLGMFKREGEERERERDVW